MRSSQILNMMRLMNYGLLLLTCFFKAAMSLEPKQNTTNWTCVHSTDPNASKATKMFLRDVDEGSLWQRDPNMSLPRCSSSIYNSSSAFKCSACLNNEELFVICSYLLPTAKVVLERPGAEISIKSIEAPKPDQFPSDLSSFVTKNDTTSKPELNSRGRIAFLILLSICLIIIIIILIIISVVCERRKRQET